MRPRNLPHINLQNAFKAQAYASHSTGRPSPVSIPRDRPRHGEQLRLGLETAEASALARRAATSVSVPDATTGLYLTFETAPGYDTPSSVEFKPSGIELVAIRTIDGDGSPREEATVFVPDGKLRYFFKRLQSYVRTTPKAEKEKRYETMFDPLESVRLATLKGLWTDDDGVFPSSSDVAVWWEVWLRRADDVLVQFSAYCDAVGAYLHPRDLRFKDRVVVYVQASTEQLAASIDVLSVMAELRRPAEAASFLGSVSPTEQREWVDDMLQGLEPPGDEAPAVTVLDTGVNRAHPLLQPLLPEAAWLTCHPEAGAADHNGHGTEMAGLAAFGDLALALTGSTSTTVTHWLESVKIIPPQGNQPEHYASVTVEGVARAELAAPNRKRVVCMAVTAPGRIRFGEPTAWSAALDAMALGRAVDASADEIRYLDADAEDPKRLIVVSAGNVRSHDPKQDHFNRSLTHEVEDPAQAWNALSVGAYTARGPFLDPSYPDWKPMAEPGDLSPHSRTGVTYAKKWANKPDVVVEGGNIAVSPRGDLEVAHPDLTLLTTSAKLAQRLLDPFWATSPATAQAAQLAAALIAEHPTYWPETIRALVVHSARWTPQMLGRLPKKPNRTQTRDLVRIFGMGVPDLYRAARSAKDALTLVSEATIRPYEAGSSKQRFREMHLYELPWPKAELAALADTEVRLRVTLSYFIEPNPGRRGWRAKHRYASHGLRFDVIGSAETPDAFLKRMNKAALDDEEGRPARPSDDDKWILGTDNTTRGSIHSDVWTGTAADLAARNTLAVVPVTGWWKEQPKHDRSEDGVRYALVVSIETDAEGVDVWTPVANQVGIPVPVEVEVQE